ncbi:hypothetical protein SAY87_018609 [Trapa incisa]|uniref:RING-type E3 ubiquitin transferase n=1 Tax=Trapa incisa TaxID=236973 RepID=A0AAN7Q0X7_9MYRT|nr:hypothetical protein SAY87_018609 [Trapa incisa]
MIDTFKLEAKIFSLEDEENEDEDYDSILFRIHYKSNIETLVMDESDDSYIEYEDFIDNTSSMYINKSQLTNFSAMKSAFGSWIDDFVPWNWMEETTNQLADTAEIISDDLSNIDEQQFIVDISIKTVTTKFNFVDDEEESSEYFEKILLEKMCNYDCKKIYNKYNSEHWPLVPNDEIEGDEYCSICCDEYINNNDSTIIKTPCSHMYHFKCILKWLRDNSGCPLCRSEINYPYDMIIIYLPMIYNEVED